MILFLWGGLGWVCCLGFFWGGGGRCCCWFGFALFFPVGRIAASSERTPQCTEIISIARQFMSDICVAGVS